VSERLGYYSTDFGFVKGEMKKNEVLLTQYEVAAQ